ncbi:MAG: hypothetical protein ACK55Z_01345, partial [bacterium]
MRRALPHPIRFAGSINGRAITCCCLPPSLSANFLAWIVMRWIEWSPMNARLKKAAGRLNLIRPSPARSAFAEVWCC